MWKIKQIFDGEFGCEELAPGEKPEEYRRNLCIIYWSSCREIS